MSMAFYERDDWRRLRYRVLRKFGFRCMGCGATAKDGATIQVDHVKPVSIYPELALDERNLQVLCRACNLGKSNVYQDDHRPKVDNVAVLDDEKELRRVVRTLRDGMLEAESKGNAARQVDLMRIYIQVQRELKSGKTGDVLAAAVKAVCEMDIGAADGGAA